MIKVLIVDDIPETRDHLSRLLGMEREIDVAGTAMDSARNEINAGWASGWRRRWR